MGLAAAYPTDINAMVMTGFSAAVNFTPFAVTKLKSASTFMSIRFPGLQLGHISTSIESQRRALFYAGNFREDIAELDFSLEDTWTIGETGNLGFAVPPAEYTGALYLTTGVQDIIFCQSPIATCSGILNSTRQMFPGVTNFDYLAVDNTGHSLMLHESAQQTFAAAHKFLDSVFIKRDKH